MTEPNVASAPGVRPLLTIVVPAYNERRTIVEVLRRVQALDITKEVIVVDDGSTDGTRQILEAVGQHIADGRTRYHGDGAALDLAGLRVILQDRNRGKGAAVRRGFTEATGDYVVVQDADLELDPRDLLTLLPPLRRGEAEVVYGSRFMQQGVREGALRHRLANKTLTVLSNTLTGYSLTDVWTCYKMFRREVIQGIPLEEDRFGFEPEVTAKLARRKHRVVEVPVQYNARSSEDGKKINWKDGVRGLWCTMRYSLLR